MRTTSRTSGLTLIEVVVTISIVGLIAAVALPAMVDFSIGTDAGALEPLRALLLEMRREAANGASVEVSVVPTSGRYMIITRRPGGLPARREGRIQLDGIRVVDPETRFHVVFRPAGMGVGDELSANGTRLRVDPATGNITVGR